MQAELAPPLTTQTKNKTPATSLNSLISAKIQGEN